MKIDEQTHSEVAKPHLGEQLGFMNWMDLINRLQLDDYAIFHEEIDPVAGSDNLPVVPHGYRHLRVHVQGAPPKLVRDTCLVRALEETWAKGGVHLHGRVDDLPTDLIQAEWPSDRSQAVHYRKLSIGAMISRTIRRRGAPIHCELT